MSRPDATEMTAEEYVAWRASHERKAHKYGVEPVVIDGIRFDSTAEGKRYWELRQLVEAGEISDLVLQRRYELTAHGVKIGVYVADFVYVNVCSGETIVEDTKGYRTPLYRWKKKHVEAQYGIKIHET